MKFNFFVLSLFYTVSSTELNPEERGRNLHTLNRHKRQDDKWDWGYVVMPGSTSSSTTDATDPRALESANPCLNRTFSPKPDFNSNGRRISETRLKNISINKTKETSFDNALEWRGFKDTMRDGECYEYIWEVKHRGEMDKRAAECFQYKLKHRGPNQPHFAIGGRDTTPGEFPHMGAVGWKAAVGTWIFKCGSSLISSKFVLTAAHCSSASSRDTTITDPEPKIIRLGDKNIIDTWSKGVAPKDEKIIRIINHPNYRSPKKYFDIALMELENNVEFTKYIQPACLWSRFDTSSLGWNATLTGWGVVETSGRTTSPELQAAVVDLIDQEQCDRLLRPSCNRNWCGLQEHQLCAGKLAGGVDACQGDSGGPLQVRLPLPTTSQGQMHYVIGVTSFGINCALPNLPGIYTRVSSFVDWIEEHVWR